MVIQRNAPIQIWGSADANTRIIVSLGKDREQTTATADGQWEVMLPARPTDKSPIELTVQSDQGTVKFSDILIGDVWLCSGQSNMQFPLRAADGGDAEIAKAKNPGVRLFTMDRHISFEPSDEIKGRWKVCSPENVKNFSAVGYLFGKLINESEKLPIGLIGSYYGGTTAQAWTSAEALEANPFLKHYVESLHEKKANMTTAMTRYRDDFLAKWDRDMTAWRETDSAKAPSAPSQPQPQKLTAPDKDPRLPTVLFNTMIHPLLPFPIKGVVWYQGEGNAYGEEEASRYAELFATMIKDWRRRWKIGDFPFIYVQLPGFEKGIGRYFPTLRESQSKTLSQPNTGMAVTIDLGEKDNIHPKNKADVAARLSRIARNLAYGEDIDYQGPMIEKIEKSHGIIRLDFGKSGKGLHSDGEQLKGFEIAGPDGQFAPVSAQIDGSSIVLSLAENENPQCVRYDWIPYLESHLFNENNLPARPFSIPVK